MNLINNLSFIKDLPSLSVIIAPIIDGTLSFIVNSVIFKLLSDLLKGVDKKPLKILLYITFPLFVKLRKLKKIKVKFYLHFD